MKTTSLSTEYVYSPFTIEHFATAPQIPQHLINALLKRAELSMLQLGDRVRVITGERKGATGRVLDIESESIRLSEWDNPECVYTVSASSIRRVFRVGDTVKVEYGEHTGRWGFVARLGDNDTVAIVLHQDGPSDIIEVRTTVLNLLHISHVLLDCRAHAACNILRPTPSQGDSRPGAQRGCPTCNVLFLTESSRSEHWQSCLDCQGAMERVSWSAKSHRPNRFLHGRNGCTARPYL